MDPDIKTPDIIRKILSTGTYSAEELDHLYRYLSKQTHPDLTGSDGEAFIKLREIFLQVRAQAEEGRRTSVFNPLKIIREAGFPDNLPPRENLYAVLMRFFRSGLHHRKLRDNPSFFRRMEELLQALRYWSSIYSPPLITLVEEYLGQSTVYMSTTKQFKDFSFSRKLFLQGTDLFFRYQASGRDTARALAEEKLTLAVIIMEKTAGSAHPAVPFGRWFLKELDKPAVLLPGL
ncbi:MAG: hypothetical protein JW760_14665 [Spirochaetales bacterium]|nr:hypothetical protein [Spirochaetales bacterium]